MKDEENEEVGRTLAARSRSTLDRRICDTHVRRDIREREIDRER